YGGSLENRLRFGLEVVAAAPDLELHRAGDCLAPRFLYDAMLEATRVGRVV
ncbi:MAG: alkene reductase, partial [Chloroflexia bacterium]|nr:alkene reductase [Chloroflexia bacterium]